MSSLPLTAAEDLVITCSDGYRLVTRCFGPRGERRGTSIVIIAPATGVQARYYWKFADFLASQGLEVVVPDYRGIGRSAPLGGHKPLRRLDTRWHEWGTLDLDAAIRWARTERGTAAQISVVGHSFGGFAALLAPSSRELAGLVMVGAQHAYWPDYHKRQRRRLFWKWHVFMPAVTSVCRYFPGRRLGWLEDLPSGVVRDWAGARSDYSRTIGECGPSIMQRTATLTLPILAVNPADDPYATPAAARRTFSYVPHARIREWRVKPEELKVDEIGHFALFNERFAGTFWPVIARWLREPNRSTREIR